MMRHSLADRTQTAPTRLPSRESASSASIETIYERGSHGASH